ncbi:DUF3618 domain-containing protein [Actinomadura barringtoniae]|uniref:DUF3618 domain-containing protein n=1 Tax=Actinomadura barringtoniae TaxID=1427535 RepID=A0A939P901_9ACTN|nr:DUF3618 domain-containing protein [Actinomadura barringtoniae]MBO2448085.1 DUF3618 domain-containing protein [Actinomadura barringtoniae]
MAERARDPEALEREIERTRLELAQTIDELADRLSPRNVAHRGVERMKAEADQVAKAARAFVYTEEPKDGEPGKINPKAVAVGVGVGVALTALVLLRRKRR